MGVINKSNYSSRHGQVITNTYISLANNRVEIYKKANDSDLYELSTSFSIYLSKESRLAYKQPLTTIYLRVELEKSEISGNLYSILYRELKKKFTDTQDD